MLRVSMAGFNPAVALPQLYLAQSVQRATPFSLSHFF
jgi:hypothetical protein